MGDHPRHEDDHPAVPITYRAEIFATREGKEVSLGTPVAGASIRELAADLVAKASELAAAATATLDAADTATGKRQDAELSGRRRRSWE